MPVEWPAHHCRSISNMDSRKRLFASMAVIAILAGTWLSFWVTAPMPTTQTATVLPTPIGLAEFSLLDQNSDPFSRASFGGHWNLVFFGFTNCPDICPLTLQILANARQQMLDAGAQVLPRIVLVSVDPERDTPGIIGQYVSHFGASVIGVTGDLAEIRKLTDGLGVFFQIPSVDDGDYSVSHSAVVIVVDPQSNFHALFSAPHEAANFAHDLPIIMASQLDSAPLIAKDIVVTRPLPGVRVSAGYLSLTNASNQEILITRVMSPNFESVGMHESFLEEGISRMVELSEIAILPGRTIHFEPGEKHLMLRNPVDTPDIVTLQFYDGDTLLLSVATTLKD